MNHCAHFIDLGYVVIGEKVMATAECVYEYINYEPLAVDTSFFIMAGEWKILKRYDGNKIAMGK